MRTRRSTASELRAVHLLTDALRGLARLFVDAGRVLAQHWPQLVGLFLAGWAGRMAFLWLTTVVSDVSPTAAVLILPLAPISTLLSLVLMLRAMSPTLPAFAGLSEGLSARQRWRDDLTVAGQVLIPFLAVYASAGLLKQDATVFLHDSTLDEWLNTDIASIDWGRANYADGWLLVGFVVVALVVRKLIAVLQLPKRHVGWVALATYVEVLWMITLANAFTSQLNNLTAWVQSRVAVARFFEFVTEIRAVIESWGEWAMVVPNAIGGVFSAAGQLVILPVTWLAIGAAVYGHGLREKTLKVETHEEVTARLKRVPQPLVRVAKQAAEPVTTPIANTLSAIGKVAAAGILPMVLFCIVFVVARSVEVLAAEGMRWIVGPGDPLRQYALEPYQLLVERGVYFVLVLSLLGSAVNAIVMGQRREDALAEKVTQEA